MPKKSSARQKKVDQVCEMCADADTVLSTLQRMHLRSPGLEDRIREMRVELTSVMEELLDQIDPDKSCTIPTHLVRSMADSESDQEG